MIQREDTIDTKTGIIYPSRTAAGNAVAHEFKLESTAGCGLVWNDVLRLSRLYRFADVATRRCIKKDGSLGAPCGAPTAAKAAKPAIRIVKRVLR